MNGWNRDWEGSRVDAIDDRVFVALRNRDRRYVLYFLLEHESASTAELADVLAGWTSETGVATREDRNERHAALCHRHVPVLEDAGLIHHDGGCLTRTDWPEPISAFVRGGLEAEIGDRGS